MERERVLIKVMIAAIFIVCIEKFSTLFVIYIAGLNFTDIFFVNTKVLCFISMKKRKDQLELTLIHPI